MAFSNPAALEQQMASLVPDLETEEEDIEVDDSPWGGEPWRGEAEGG